jgi:hypothetical protein
MKYAVSQFDASAFVVIDQGTLEEICVCSNGNAKERAEKIAKALEVAENISAIHAQANADGWFGAKESCEKEIADLRRKLGKALEALKAVEHVSGLSFWGANLTKERCPLCGTPKGEGHKYDTDCLIYQALKDEQ